MRGGAGAGRRAPPAWALSAAATLPGVLVTLALYSHVSSRLLAAEARELQLFGDAAELHVAVAALRAGAVPGAGLAAGDGKPSRVATRAGDGVGEPAGPPACPFGTRESGRAPPVAAKYFPGQRFGAFVEVGAGDGRFESRANYYEATQCWRGVAFEPSTVEFPKLERNRPGSVAINGAACASDGMRSGFHDVTLRGLWTGWSGFEATWSTKHRNEVNDAVGALGYAVDAIDVECVRIATVLEQLGLATVDYLAISAEGGEVDALEGIDFGRASFAVIEVDTGGEREREDAVADFLRPHGYRLDSAFPAGAKSAVFTKPQRRVAAS